MSPENACTPSAGGSAPPDEPSGCARGEPGSRSGAGCSVDPSPLAEGTDGCGAGWSSPPKGRPLKTTNATKRRTAPNATAVRLTRSPQRFASPTVTASCSAASFCGPGRHSGTEGLTAPLRSRAALSTGRGRRTTSPPGPRARTASRRAASFCCPGRRGGADGSTAPLRSRAALSTGRARRTTSPPGPRARTASRRAASFCRTGRRGGADGLSGTVSGSSRAVLSRSSSSRAVSSTGRARRTISRQCVRTGSCSAALSCGLGCCGGAEGLSATVSGSSRAVLSRSSSSRAVLSTGRARRTTSRQCARTASCSEESFCCPGRRGGTGGLSATVSSSSRAVLSPVVRSEPLRSRAGASAQFAAHRYLIVSGHVIPRFEGDRAARRRITVVLDGTAICYTMDIATRTER